MAVKPIGQFHYGSIHTWHLVGHPVDAKSVTIPLWPAYSRQVRFIRLF
ncbi:hypothetical protein [Rosettibacter firmus]